MPLDLDTLTLDQLRWALAGAKRECSRLHDDTWFAPCPDCSESVNGPRGQGYVLPDTVRELCDSQTTADDMGHRRHLHNKVGWADSCPGYSPTESMEVWAKALWPVMAHDTLQALRDYSTAMASGDLLGALRIAAVVLQRQGVKLEYVNEEERANA